MLYKAQLIGRLGRDPEVRYTQDGACIANLAVATSEPYKDKAGERQDKTEWHRVVLFGRLGEVAGEYLKKGSLASIEGRIRTRKWKNQEGQDQYTTEIVGSTLKMLGRPAEGGSAPPKAAPQPEPHRAESAHSFEAAEDSDFDDDIPY